MIFGSLFYLVTAEWQLGGANHHSAESGWGKSSQKTSRHNHTSAYSSRYKGTAHDTHAVNAKSASLRQVTKSDLNLESFC